MKRTILVIFILFAYANAEYCVKPHAASISAFAENGVECQNYANVSRREPDLSLVKELLCPVLSGRYADAADGSIWMYAANYAVKFEAGKVAAIIRSPVGMKKDANPTDKKFQSERPYFTVEKKGLSSPLLYFFFNP